MPFPFSYVCDLLESFDRIYRRQTPILDKDLDKRAKADLTRWLKSHCRLLNTFDTDADVVMSFLRPELDTERIYGVTPESLGQIIARSMELLRQEYVDLQEWRHSEFVDLAGFVQRAMQRLHFNTNRVSTDAVMTEEIHQALLQMAAFNPRSSPNVRDLSRIWQSPDGEGALGRIYSRMQAKEAKWLTRFILKDYGPIKVPQSLDLTAEHSFLPNCVTINMQIPNLAPPALHRSGTEVIRAQPSSTPKVVLAPSRSTAEPVTPNNVASGHKTLQASTHGLPTPPTSSLPNMSPQFFIRRFGDKKIQVTLPTNLHGVSPTSKSSLEGLSTSTLTYHSSVAIVQANSRTTRARSHGTTASRNRSVLGTISSNITRASQHSSPSTASQSNKILRTFVPGYSLCKLSAQPCNFKQCLFLVSPCVQFKLEPSRLDTLLAKHGLRQQSTVSSLSHDSIPRRCPHTKRRYRKIALVDSKSVEQTTIFLKRIGKLDLQRNGMKEWVEVYDYRLLERISRLESGELVGYDPWKQSWVGAV